MQSVARELLIRTNEPGNDMTTTIRAEAGCYSGGSTICHQQQPQANNLYSHSIDCISAHHSLPIPSLGISFNMLIHVLSFFRQQRRAAMRAASSWACKFPPTPFGRMASHLKDRNRPVASRLQLNKTCEQQAADEMKFCIVWNVLLIGPTQSQELSRHDRSHIFSMLSLSSSSSDGPRRNSICESSGGTIHPEAARPTRPEVARRRAPGAAASHKNS